jgi:hypothetical protein
MEVASIKTGEGANRLPQAVQRRAEDQDWCEATPLLKQITFFFSKNKEFKRCTRRKEGTRSDLNNKGYGGVNRWFRTPSREVADDALPLLKSSSSIRYWRSRCREISAPRNASSAWYLQSRELWPSSSSSSSSYKDGASFGDDGWFLLKIPTGFIPLYLMIIWRASFLCGWWMIFAHDHNRIYSPRPYDYLTSFLPLWMMDDSCSRSQQDTFPWTFIMIISRASFLRGWWMILAHHHEWISPGYKSITSFLCGWWWMNLCSQPYTIPLVMIVTSLLLWMMDESYSPTNHNWSPSESAHYVGWMVCAQKKLFSVIFLYRYSYPWARVN